MKIELDNVCLDLGFLLLKAAAVDDKLKISVDINAYYFFDPFNLFSHKK